MKLTSDALGALRAEAAGSLTQRIAQRAVTHNGFLATAINPPVIARNDFTFSVDIDSEAVANQNQSGRCWMFACLNTLRLHMEKSLKLPKGSFELSQNYTFFYDKLEKANFFHQQIIDTASAPLDDRKVSFLLQTPQQDGGDWDLIADLVKKYGVVPRQAMGETHASTTSAQLNTILNRKLRQDALELRDLVVRGTSLENLESTRMRMIGEVYRILSIALGTPPEKVDFEYRDTDDVYHVTRDLTPLEFLSTFIPVDVDDYVGVINVPIESMPYGKVYGIETSDEIAGGLPNRYLNVDMETLKQLTVKQLQEGEAVWFGSDVMQSSDVASGVMSTDLYSLDELLGVEFGMDKAQRYRTRESLPTHAMTIGGVDLVDGTPTKWKVENSWGTDSHGGKVGDNGYFVMEDGWMSEYVYEVVIRKDLLSEEHRKAFDETPIMLPFWSTFNPI
ncbi:aminopeptidase C [Microbacterium koreense]|uniref:Aminopeptidase n=1 Tax=Microbacterium koreense TaxID=323761 RepID=A0ABW2ZNM5_9MICO